MAEDPRQYLSDNEEGFRLGFEGQRAGIWTAMPGIVQSVDLAKMTCVVQLAIQGRSEDQSGNINWQNISPILDVPIVFPSAGGFSITLPMAAGDEVLVMFASRCIDAWWQNGGYANVALDFRMHDLSDGFAIPGPKSQPKVIGSISATDLQIRNATGTVFLSLGVDGKIGLANATTTLKTVLNNLTSAVNTFATSAASATSVGQIASAASALVTALAPVTTAIGALFKMTVRALSPTGDFTFGASQLNFLSNSPAAVAQVVQTSLLLWLGEWYLDNTLGMPWLEGVLGKHNTDTADATVQDYILQVQGVTDIADYASVSQQPERNYLATATIDTLYGETEVQIANTSDF